MKQKNYLQKSFHSSKNVIEHINVCFFFLISLWTCSHSLNKVNSLHCFMWFLLYYFLHLFDSNCFVALGCLYSSPMFIAIQFIWKWEFFKNHPQRRLFCNVSWSNLKNVLKRNLRTYRTREWTFGGSGGTNSGNLTNWRQPCWCLCWFDVFTHLPKRALDTLLGVQ